MQRDIEAERLGQRGGLHHAGDAEVVFGIGAQEVGGHLGQPGRIRLEPADMLGQQKRRADPLAQQPVHMRGLPAIGHGVFEPVEVVLVAGPAHPQGIGEGVDVACRIGHQRHPAADRAGHRRDGADLGLGVALGPAVHLVAAIAHLEALHGEIGIGLGRVEPAVAVARDGAGIGRKLPAVAAQKGRDGQADLLSVEVPQADVDRRIPGARKVPVAALAALVEAFAGVAVLPGQRGQQRQRLG